MIPLTIEKNSDESLLQALLFECLPTVEQQGWNVLSASYLTSYGLLGQFFPGGVEEIVLLHQRSLNQKMIEKITDPLMPLTGVTAKIVSGIQQRLLLNSVALTKQTHRFFMHPFHIDMARKCLYDIVNTLWYAAGDTSTDFNFYTKRGILAAVFTATELYWIQDTSPGYYKTWNFLDKLLRQVHQLGKLKQIFSPFCPS